MPDGDMTLAQFDKRHPDARHMSPSELDIMLWHPREKVRCWSERIGENERAWGRIRYGYDDNGEPFRCQPEWYTKIEETTDAH